MLKQNPWFFSSVFSSVCGLLVGQNRFLKKAESVPLRVMDCFVCGDGETMDRGRERLTQFVRNSEAGLVGWLVCWCLEPTQPQRITSEQGYSNVTQGIIRYWNLEEVRLLTSLEKTTRLFFLPRLVGLPQDCKEEGLWIQNAARRTLNTSFFVLVSRFCMICVFHLLGFYTRSSVTFQKMKSSHLCFSRNVCDEGEK